MTVYEESDLQLQHLATVTEVTVFKYDHWKFQHPHTSAQVHLRHLVGGRARSFTGCLPHERIFQVSPH